MLSSHLIAFQENHKMIAALGDAKLLNPANLTGFGVKHIP